MNYLIVVAHPDDEVLGAGAAIYKLARQGQEVSVLIMSYKAQARANRPTDAELENDAMACMDILGVKKVYTGEFPNIQMNTVPHLHLVQKIESCMVDCGAEVIITHHPADLNNDHHQTSLACQAASRLFQRRTDVPQLKELLYMEVPSATEWALDNASNPFRPDTFYEVGREAVEKKIEALSQYRGVMRPFPHPRSPEAIMGLAAYRGGQSGCVYAEAFECAIRRVLL